MDQSHLDLIPIIGHFCQINVDRAAVAELVREAILCGEFAEGEQLPESDLARRYGVSRNPLREALQILTGEGLVTGSANRGVRARALLPKETDEIFCIRRLVEGAPIDQIAAAVLEVRIPFTSNFKSSNRARSKPSLVCSLEQRR